MPNTIFQPSEEWLKSVSIFENLVKYIKPDPIVLLGDSITNSFRINEFLPGHYFLNRGIDGDTTLGLLNRLESSVIALKPSHLFILIGTNDLLLFSDDKILSNYKQILSDVITKCPECKTCVLSILPTRDLPDRPNDRISEINLQLERLAINYELKYLKANALYCDERNEMKVEYSLDGLHLNQSGYNLLAKMIKGYL